MKKSTASGLGWTQVPQSGNVRQAIKSGKTLRVDCDNCGRRFFDLQSALIAGVVKSLQSREDIKGSFRCSPKNELCAVQMIAFVVWKSDKEKFDIAREPKGGARPLW